MKRFLRLMCVGVISTLPHLFTLGLINDAQAQINRKDLNGLLLNHPSNGRTYWIDQGKRRWISGPAVYNQLFPGKKNENYIDVELIQEAPALTMENRIVHCAENGHKLNNRTYFLDQGTKRWISGPNAFKRSFGSPSVTRIPCPALVNIPDGSAI